MKFITIGELLMRLSPPDYEKIRTTSSYVVNFGGAEANVAVSLANLGVDTTVFTVLPDNDIGRSAVRSLKANDVHTSPIIFGGERMGVYFLEEGIGVRSSKVIYDRKHSAFAEYDYTTVDFKALLEGYDWLHLSGITPALSNSCQILIEAAIYAARQLGDWCRQIAEWIQSGVIGDVYEVHCWTDRPIWPQGLMKPNDTPKCPKTLDWDLWIGPAQKRPYNPVYTPWNWRGWWDFGTGALGDMACHIMDPLYWALDLKYPTSVIGSSTLSNLYSPPHAQIVTYTFPARPPKGNVKMPEVKVYWYDGGLMPPRPEELKDGQMMGDENGGIIFIGTKGKIMTGCYGMNPTLLPVSDMEHFNQPKPTIPRVKGGNGDIWSTNAHEQDWIRACKESPENRTEASSNFQFSGPFNEMVVMGVLAVRLSGLQGLHRELQWDGENMRFTNISPNDKIKIVTVDDFKVIDGDPRFDRRFAEFNAAEMANEWIKHTYNNGFSLPDMPR